MVKPNVGDTVWYWHTPEQRSSGTTQPIAATIVLVHNDRLVNLMLFTPKGAAVGASLVKLLQDADEAPDMQFCEWPKKVN